MPGFPEVDSRTDELCENAEAFKRMTDEIRLLPETVFCPDEELESWS